VRCSCAAVDALFPAVASGSRAVPNRSGKRNPALRAEDRQIDQIFEGTAQVQRLVVSRMQRTDYQERLKRAAAVVEAAAAA